MKSRIFSAVIIYCLILVLMAGCGKTGTNSNTEPEPEETASATAAPSPEVKKDPVTITFVKNSDATLNGIEEIFKNYE